MTTTETRASARNCPEVVGSPTRAGVTHGCIRSAGHDDQHVAYLDNGTTVAWGANRRPQPPTPANLDAMSAAYRSGDSVAIAREKHVYDQQLIAAGFAPLTPAPRLDGVDL
jgi:hypothetical protein